MLARPYRCLINSILNKRSLFACSFFSIFLVACTDLSFELEDVEHDEIQLWIGSERQSLESAWEDEPQIQEGETHTSLTWVISPPIDVAEVKGQDWESGPSTEGIDDDLLSFMRRSISQTCMAVFILDESGKVVAARLQRFKGAQDCDITRIPIPQPKNV